MKLYPSRSMLTRFASQYSFEDQRALKKSAENRNPAGATFLSHSSKDEDLVVGAVSLLEGHGASVYIDKKDPALPPYTSKETAKGLKSRINQCRKFVLLASENSKESKWVPWELGISDGFKGLDRIAILPAVEEQTKTGWTSWEYLGLYDRIIWGDLNGHDERLWMVLDEEKNTAIPLSDWLAA